MNTRRKLDPVLESLGEYVPEQGSGSALEIARAEFLDVMARTYPELIRSLREEVLPDYRSGRNCAAKLRQWAARFGAEGESWILQDAEATLRYWAKNPRAAEGLRRKRPGAAVWTGVSEDERRFHFEHRGWTPTMEQWRDAEKAIRKAFDERLRDYRSEMDQLMKSRQYRAMPDVRQSSQFEWLVRYQFGGMSPGAIGKLSGCTTWDAVQQGVRKAAKLVGMELRSGRRGPKRKA